MSSNLPPGCTHRMIEAQFQEGPCEVCGYHVDACVCDVCPQCGTYGNPECYVTHGMERRTEQLLVKARFWLREKQLEVAELRFYVDYLEDKLAETNEAWEEDPS